MIDLTDQLSNFGIIPDYLEVVYFVYNAGGLVQFLEILTTEGQFPRDS